VLEDAVSVADWPDWTWQELLVTVTTGVGLTVRVIGAVVVPQEFVATIL
jgi:hypothetical protein